MEMWASGRQVQGPEPAAASHWVFQHPEGTRGQGGENRLEAGKATSSFYLQRLTQNTEHSKCGATTGLRAGGFTLGPFVWASKRSSGSSYISWEPELQ